MSKVLLKLSKKILDEAVSYVLPVASGRQTLPILSCLLFSTKTVGSGDAATKFLVISGCDLEKKLSVRIDKDQEGVEVMEDMNIALPAKKLNSLLSNLPKDGTVTLTDNPSSGNVTLKPSTIRSKYTLSVLPGDEFPDISLSTKDIKYIEVSRVALLDAINKIERGAPAQDVRHYLNGLHFKTVGGNELDMVSTDGHRLFHATIPAKASEGKVFPDISLILPKPTVGSLSKLLKHGEDEDVRIGTTEQHLFVKVGSRQLFTCLISGQYPQYESVIPSSFAVEVELEIAQLLESLKRCMIVHSEANKHTSKNVFLYLGNKKLKLQATEQSKKIEEVYEELDAPDCSPVEVPFQGQYMIDALTAFNSETVKFGFNGTNSAFMLSSEADGLNAVIMPVRA